LPKSSFDILHRAFLLKVLYFSNGEHPSSMM
jgi:hypothetical protein